MFEAYEIASLSHKSVPAGTCCASNEIKSKLYRGYPIPLLYSIPADSNLRYSTSTGTLL